MCVCLTPANAKFELCFFVRSSRCSCLWQKKYNIKYSIRLFITKLFRIENSERRIDMLTDLIQMRDQNKKCCSYFALFSL